MKKLSFLELEKEMETLSEEEAFKTKAGGQPRTDCYFQAMDYIYDEMDFSKVTVSGLEGKFDGRYGTTEAPHPSSDGVTLSRTGAFAAHFANDNYNGIHVTALNGADLLPETTKNGSNEYMAIIKNGSGNGHAVVFDHYNRQNDNYTFWDEQNQDWVTKDSSDVIGVVKFHEDENAGRTTTMPTTTMPTTTPMPG